MPGELVRQWIEKATGEEAEEAVVLAGGIRVTLRLKLDVRDP